MNPTELEEIKDRLSGKYPGLHSHAKEDLTALIHALEEAWAEIERLTDKYDFQLLVKQRDRYREALLAIAEYDSITDPPVYEDLSNVQFLADKALQGEKKEPG